MQKSGSIINALIRCTRQDREAKGLFDLTRADLGLWVLELDYTDDHSQAEQIAGIYQQLLAISNSLQRLREGSDDYTLHLAFDLPEQERILIPPTLSSLASDCGFSIEIYATRDEDG